MKQLSLVLMGLILLACTTVSIGAAQGAYTQDACILDEGGFWYGWVHSNGMPVETRYGAPLETIILDDGRIYYITAGETFTPSGDWLVSADAQFYSTDINKLIWIKPQIPLGVYHSFLQINEQDVNWADTPDLVDHKYTVQFTGLGAPIGLRIYDWYDENQENNDCHLPVCMVAQPDGCTPGAWKRWTDAWVGYSTDDTISSVFTGAEPFGDLTLLDGLKLKGGPGTDGAKEILLRAAIAGLLNEAKFGEHYGPYGSTEALIAAVNAALASGDRETMIDLAAAIDDQNNQFCPTLK